MLEEGLVLLKGFECGWMYTGMGEHHRGGSSAFLSDLEQLDSSRCERRLLIVDGYRIYILVGVHGKLV